MSRKKRFRKLEVPGWFTSPPDTAVDFDGKSYPARSGEPLTLTLLANGVRVLGRSAKYHRPRGLFCGRGTCGHCLAQVDGQPNLRLCRCEARRGERVESQNVMGSARFDLLATIDWLFPGGLDHHHLMIESATLNRMALAMAHELSGLGKLPPSPATRSEVLPNVRRVQVAVVGGGPAGRAAAEKTCAAGLDTIIIDREALSGPGFLGSSQVIGFYDDRYLVVVDAERHFWIEPQVIILATGAVEQLPSVPGNDLPGVFARRAAERALDCGVLPGRRRVVAADREADASTRRRGQELTGRLLSCGAQVELTLGLGARTGAANALDAELCEVEGRSRVKRVTLEGGIDAFDCDALIWCGRPVPAYELPRQLGLSTPYSATVGGFVPEHETDGRTERPELFVAGELAGVEADHAAAHGARVGNSVVAAIAVQPSAAEVS